MMFVGLSAIAQKTVTVVIDPGHGGHDPGHLSHNSSHLAEKDLNLKISKYLGGYIEKYLQNVKVVYTRTGDTYPSLDDRVGKANNINADYFLSIHCNGNDRKSVRGTESHVHNMSLSKSVTLAKNIENQFSKRAGRKSRGVKDERDLQHSLQVLKYTNMPSVLVECGFMTNAKEANFLNSSYGQEIIASAIFRAFRKTIEDRYPQTAFRKTDNSNNNTTAQSTPSTNNGGSYCIQIASSKEPKDTNDHYFKKTGMAVSRKELNTSSAYKYIYTVGSYGSKSEAKADLKKIKEKGFNDAIVIKS
jgi:N-acetylmuramoyl-L-alanine amidase